MSFGPSIRMRLPSVCIGVGVKFMTPFEMLRRERARFVLACPRLRSGRGARP
jgi:hypothetical protein